MLWVRDMKYLRSRWQNMREIIFKAKRVDNGECAASSTCDYIDIEGHRRGCSPLECKEKGIFTPRQGSRKRKVRRL